MTILATERVSNEGEGSDLKVAPRPSNCKAKNNASFRGNLRCLKFVLEAYPHWQQLGYELPPPSAAGTLGQSMSRILRIANDSDKQSDQISQLDSCAWITSKPCMLRLVRLYGT